MRSSPRAFLIPVLKTHFDHLNRRDDLKRKQEQKLLRKTATGTAKLPVQQRYSQPAAYDEHPHSHQLVSQQHLLPIIFLEDTYAAARCSAALPSTQLFVAGPSPQDMHCMSASCPAEHKPALYYCLLRALGICAGDTEPPWSITSKQKQIWAELLKETLRIFWKLLAFKDLAGNTLISVQS